MSRLLFRVDHSTDFAACKGVLIRSHPLTYTNWLTYSCMLFDLFLKKYKAFRVNPKLAFQMPLKDDNTRYNLIYRRNCHTEPSAPSD